MNPRIRPNSSSSRPLSCQASITRRPCSSDHRFALFSSCNIGTSTYTRRVPPRSRQVRMGQAGDLRWATDLLTTELGELLGSELSDLESVDVDDSDNVMLSETVLDADLADSLEIDREQMRRDAERDDS